MVAKTAKAAVSKEAGTALVNWEERLANEANIASKMEEGVGGASFFSIRGGVLSFNNAAVPGNQMGVIILDAVLERTYYTEEFDPENPAPPTCFAFGREDDEMSPHENVVKAGQEQHPTCSGCEWDQWGSADKGKGKACRQVRRVALIPAGTFDAQGRFSSILEESHYKDAAMGYLKVPVTSVKTYAGYVRQVATTMRRPPFAMFTKVSVRPDPKTQVAVNFEALGEVPLNLLDTLLKRVNLAKAEIEFPYDLTPRDEAPAKPAKVARGKAGSAPRRPAKF